MNNVLIVNEDEETSDKIRRFFEKNNIGVVQTYNRENAFDYIERFRFDLIVVEYWIGGRTMDSFIDLARDYFDACPYIIITSSCDNFPNLTKRLRVDFSVDVTLNFHLFEKVIYSILRKEDKKSIDSDKGK